ncbi:hypothetical protein THAOC_12403 [Thalassiosira oceanica]|uniref:Ysc84 actin-binding domain-containing protein n=1 Tax=Thalassiosira oceanica TaxID=159749 RepID=K0T066_THAOC|nr:hypothetical protein THAOC_12403 [Thalassiosira oceanica]|eukprot:EJK66656.1 hypothetical protein THAOC_12403 [Thalassiosira oceanica]
METFKKHDALKPYFEQSYGCAVFGQIAKGGIFFVGGAYGTGDVYKFERTGEETKFTRTFKANLMQVSAGWILGGEVYQEIIFFETEEDYSRFTSAENFEFGADAKAVGLTAAVSTKATTMGNQGLQMGVTADETAVKGFDERNAKLEFTKATVAGQKFNVTPL